MEKHTRYIFSAVIVVALVAVGLSVCGSSDTDAATDPYVRGTNAYIFSETSSSYSELVYLSDLLPTTLNPSEWVHATDGYWYNTNQGSGDYGNILRYGAIVGISDDQIRHDIADKYSFFPVSDFRLIQIDYTVSKTCTFPITLTHGSDSKTFTQTENSTRAESGVTSYLNYFSDSYESVGLFSVGTDPLSDFKVSDIRGVYSAHMECSADPGASKTWSALSIPTDRVDLTGHVYDVDGTPIKAARVVYSEGAGGGDAYTDSAGLFTIHATYGKVIQITSVSKDGYNFGTINPGYNNDPAENNTSLVPAYYAREHSVTVNVLDQSDVPVANTRVGAYWYYMDGANVAVDALGKEGTQKFMTDADGNVTVMFAEPPVAGALLYFCLESETGSPDLHYGLHAMPAAGGPAFIPAASAIMEASNMGFDTSQYTDPSFYTSPKVLKVLEKSILVTVESGNSSPVPLKGMTVQADWVFQAESSPNYVIDFDKATAGATTSGSVFVNGTTDSSGDVRVYYVAPNFTPTSGRAVFLLIRGVNIDHPASIDQSFTFDCQGQIDLPYASSPSTLDALVAGMHGAVAFSYDAVATDYILHAKEDGFYLNATFAGDVPEFSAGSVALRQNGVTTTLTPVAGAPTGFSAVVKGGASLEITVTADGYTFSPTRLALISDTTPLTITGNAINPTIFERAAPVKVLVSPTNPEGTVDIQGVSVGSIVKVTYTSGRLAVTRNVMVLADPVGYVPLQMAAGMVTNFHVSSIGYFVIPSGDISFGLYPLVQKNIVVYNAEAGSPPEISNIRANVTISASYGSDIWSAKTNTNGVATITVPDIPQLTFKFGIYTLEGTPVTSGAYAGYTAFNLVGREPVPIDTYITLNIRYKVITNVAGDADSKDLMEPDKLKLKVGDSITRIATPVDGLKFENWLLAGNKVTGTVDDSCTFYVTSDLDNVDLVAVYSAYQPPETSAPVDMTAVAIGLVGIIVAIIAFAYVFTQVRRY